MTERHALGDLAAAGTIVATIVGWLPYIAAGFGVIWYCVQFWESPLCGRWRKRRRLARLEHLEQEHTERAGELERLRKELDGGD